MKIENSNCVPQSLIFIQIKPEINTKKIKSVDFSLMLLLQELDSSSDFVQSAYEGVSKSLRFLEKESGVSEEFNAKINFVISGKIGILDYTFKNPLKSKSYNVEYTQNPETSSRLLVMSPLYSYSKETFLFTYENTKYVTDEMKTSEKQGEIAGILSGNPLSSNPAVGESLTIAATFDPTGTLTRFSQIIKITNRVYYININYGSKLNSFLDGIDKVSGIKKKYPNLSYLKKTKSFRGRLTEKKISGDFYADFDWRIIVYFISWTVRTLFWLIAGRRVPVWLLFSAYFVPRIHLMIFNAFFLDFLFYSTISAMHYRLIPSSVLSYICLFMIHCDLTSMLNAARDRKLWLYFLRVKKSRFIFTPEDQSSPRKQIEKNGDGSSSKFFKLEPVNNNVLVLNSNSKVKNKTKKEGINYQDLKKKGLLVIDYDKTWENINLNVHLMSFFTTPLKAEKKVYQSRISRNLVILHYARMYIYQILIPVGQYLPGFTIFLLLSFEIGKVVSAIYIHMKYRALVDTIVIFAETFQHVFMSIFFMIAFTISIYYNESDLGLAWQTFAIYILLAAIVLEYLLLTLKMVSLCRTFIRNRKLGKDEKKPRIGWFIYLKPSYQNRLEDISVVKDSGLLVEGSGRKPRTISIYARVSNKGKIDTPKSSFKKNFAKNNRIRSSFSGQANIPGSDQNCMAKYLASELNKRQSIDQNKIPEHLENVGSKQPLSVLEPLKKSPFSKHFNKAANNNGNVITIKKTDQNKITNTILISKAGQKNPLARVYKEEKNKYDLSSNSLISKKDIFN